MNKETGMKLLADKDTARVSAPMFTPHQMPGPSVPAGTTSPFDYFSLFFYAKIIDEICVNSNTYAELYKVKYPNSYKFYPEDGLTQLSFYLFMSIVNYMGLHPRPDYFSYWSMALMNS